MGNQSVLLRRFHGTCNHISASPGSAVAGERHHWRMEGVAWSHPHSKLSRLLRYPSRLSLGPVECVILLTEAQWHLLAAIGTTAATGLSQKNSATATSSSMRRMLDCDKCYSPKKNSLGRGSLSRQPKAI